MWQLELNDVFIQIIPRWMTTIIQLPDTTPRLNSGEFIIIGDQTNGDLLKAAGFYKPGATFDFAVPLGDPDYGPHAFTFYKHPDPEWNDTREGTAVRYEDVLWRVKNKVNAAMMTTVAPAAFAIGPQPNKVFPIG